MKFITRYDKTIDPGQTFDKEKICVTKNGQEINCFDAIQAANIDTNIYDVIKKYHCNESEAIEYLKNKGGTDGVYSDIVELQKNIKDFGDIQQVCQKANQMFEQLPAEVKQKYGNNLELFLKEKEKQQQTKETEVNKETNTKENKQ